MRSIGSQVKKRRRELGLSLQKLAEQAELTASFLSQIERDVAVPSIASLEKLSKALSLPIFHFLIRPPDKSPVMRWKTRQAVPLAERGVLGETLAPDSRHKMSITLMTVAAGERYTPDQQDEGEVSIVLLEGTLEVSLEKETYTLEPGDSIYCEAEQMQSIHASNRSNVRCLFIATSPRPKTFSDQDGAP